MQNLVLTIFMSEIFVSKLQEKTKRVIKSTTILEKKLCEPQKLKI